MAAKLRVLNAGTLRTITRLRIKQAGVLRTIKTLKVMHGGALRTVASFADPLSVSATNVGAAGSGTLTSAESKATVSGGFSPFTYAWTLVTNGGGTASTANSPTLAATTFTKEGISEDVTDVWRITVTDAIGSTATDDVAVSYVYLSGS